MKHEGASDCENQDSHDGVSAQVHAWEARSPDQGPHPSNRGEGGDAFSVRAVEVLRELLKDYPRRDSLVRFWDGLVWEPQPGRPERFTLSFRSPGGFRRAFSGMSTLALGRAYMQGDFDVEGDITAAFRMVDHLLANRPSLSNRLRIMLRLRNFPGDAPTAEADPAARLPQGRTSRARARAAIAHHYDLSSDFFRLWLDERMVYSCAYFHSDQDHLAEAQVQKLDYICRKLDLRPGQRFLDIGSGWGALIAHAAEKYGVDATGVTLSKEQAAWTQRLIARRGLADQCRAQLLDFHDLPEDRLFDCVASVGMVEHVHRSRLEGYFGKVGRLLKPGGRFLNHGIARSHHTPLRGGPSFMDKYVFPDSDIVPICTMLTAAESTGFELRDVENLREHYALTVRNWLERFEARATEIRAIVGDARYRAFRVYLAGSAYDFERGRLDLFQSLLVRPTGARSGMALTRAHWYRHAPPPLDLTHHPANLGANAPCL